MKLRACFKFVNDDKISQFFGETRRRPRRAKGCRDGDRKRHPSFLITALWERILQHSVSKKGAIGSQNMNLKHARNGHWNYWPTRICPKPVSGSYLKSGCRC